MQRLLSLKHASSNLSKKVSNNPNSASLLTLSHPHKTSTQLTKPTHQKDQHHFLQHHLFGPPLREKPSPHFLPCQSYHSLSGKVYGFLYNPLLSKQFSCYSVNTLFRVLRTSTGDCKLGISRVRFARRFSGFDRSFGSQWSSWRSWFRRLSAHDMVLGLIIVNVAVFMLWRIADRRFMVNNFMISLDNFKSGRIHTLVTSAFSHIDAEHIISNMIGLYFFGMNIGRTFGPEYLLKLYLAGAVGGSVFYLVHHAYLALSSKGQGMWIKDPSRTPGLGASGAVNAILLLDIFLNPRATLLFDFIIPVPAILLGIFLIGKDLLRMIEGDSNISGSAHLGGAAVASLAYARIKRGRF